MGEGSQCSGLRTWGFFVSEHGAILVTYRLLSEVEATLTRTIEKHITQLKLLLDIVRMLLYEANSQWV